MDFGKALRISRAISGMQQKELAEKTGFDASYISLVEKGRRRPSQAAINTISSVLKIPPSLFTLLAIGPDDTDLADANELEELGQTLTELLFTARPSGTQA
jgi:transcriptional regulator with XRE-family HTH domain